MQPIVEYTPDYQVKLLITHEGLEAIKHIVSLAPQEAQWFHTVEPLRIDNTIYLQLSTRLYIPKQNTSLTQVDTNSSMMVEFYHELKKEYPDQVELNKKLKAMTCWCHSHHNMAPNPSGQDMNQFADFVNSSIQQNQDTWQVMLIFNKKDQFYSRVYDPTNGITWQGVPLVENKSMYDFTYIDSDLKTKLIKPKPKMLPLVGLNPTSLFSGTNQNIINDNIAKDMIVELYSDFRKKEVKDTSKVKVLPKHCKYILEAFKSYFTVQEYYAFVLLVGPKSNRKLLREIYDLIMVLEPNSLDEIGLTDQTVSYHLNKYFSSTKHTIKDLKRLVSAAISAAEAETFEEYKEIINVN